MIQLPGFSVVNFSDLPLLDWRRDLPGLPVYTLQHADRGGRFVEHIEVNARYVGFQKLLDLSSGKLDSDLELSPLIVSRGSQAG